ncbi:MAG TPA: hypothetical protein VNE60_14540 [Gemmatimonadaceae bacterium]|nr:hypothetical protein [Gemmatimonadaceae bacterium]
MSRSLALLSLLCLSPWTAAGAQYQPAPTQYTIVNAGGGQTQHFYRDGDRVLVDLTMPKSAEQPVAIHMRTIVDVPSTTQLSWDLLKASVPCNSPGKGDWGDPFGLWQQMALDDSVTPKATGQDTVNGITATVFEKREKRGTVKLWRDATYGLLVKAVMTPTGAEAIEMFETKEFRVGAPTGSVFAVPKRCVWKR